MAGKSTYQEGNVLKWIKGTAFPAVPTNVYVALFTTAPTLDDGTGAVEVSGGAYARQAVTFGALSAASPGQQMSNSSAITFPTATANWGTVVAGALYDSLTTGNLIYWNTLTASQVVNNGNQVQFAVGALITKED